MGGTERGSTASGAAAAQRIIITGPTASGKGALAIAVARRVRAEIISLDSMKVFRGMDVGTAKPPITMRRDPPIHLVDIADPWEDFSVGRYLPLALETMRGIEARARTALFAGGTALYLNALVHGLFRGPAADWELRAGLERRAGIEGLDALHRELLALDPHGAARIHPNDRKRILRALEVYHRTGRPLTEHWRDASQRLEPGTHRVFGIAWDRRALYERIDRRVERMVREGLIEEVRRLRAAPGGLGRCASKCIGYRQVIEGLESGWGEEEIVARIQRDTRRFAKQQMTWFRRFPIEWLPWQPPERLATVLLERLRAPAPRELHSE